MFSCFVLFCFVLFLQCNGSLWPQGLLNVKQLEHLNYLESLIVVEVLLKAVDVLSLCEALGWGL